MTLSPRIHAVSMGKRETTADVAWHDIDDCSAGFPPLVKRETLRWPGQLHHAEIVAKLMEETP